MPCQSTSESPNAWYHPAVGTAEAFEASPDEIKCWSWDFIVTTFLTPSRTVNQDHDHLNHKPGFFLTIRNGDLSRTMTNLIFTQEKNVINQETWISTIKDIDLTKTMTNFIVIQEKNNED